VADTIDVHDLVPMDVFGASEPFIIDLVYADKDHPENIFGINLYHKNARMILHRDMARIVVLAARALHNEYGWTLILKDGLRTVDAQERLMQTDIVRANPQWLEEPRMLSLPGKGAHPRAMAIDVSVKGVDMGTRFDEMTPQSARAYDGFPKDILENRQRLEKAFVESAQKLGLPMLPLPSEWWDFRFPASYHERFAPLHETDLPDSLKMMGAHTDDAPRFDKIAKEVLNSL